MARPRIRSQHQFHIFASNISLGWRVIRNITFADGEAKVERGTFRRVFNEFSVHIGYQPLNAAPTDKDLPSRNSNPSITVAEMEANAGLDGWSATANMTEDRREERVSLGCAPEDFVERATEKVRLWTKPAPGRGDRAVRVYPKAAFEPCQ